MATTLETGYGRGIRAPERYELVVTPDSVKARISDFFREVGLDRNGKFHPDPILTVIVNTVEAEADYFEHPDLTVNVLEHTAPNDPDFWFPNLNRGTHLFSDKPLIIHRGKALVNGEPFAQRIVPDDSSKITFFEGLNDPEGNYFGFEKRQVQMIHSLSGIYTTPYEWFGSPRKPEVSIVVLDFDDGGSRVFVPRVVNGIILPQEYKIEIAKQLGVKV